MRFRSKDKMMEDRKLLHLRIVVKSSDASRQCRKSVIFRRVASATCAAIVPVSQA